MPLNNPVTPVELGYGQYTGDSTANRAVAHGMKRTPRIVFLLLPGVGGCEIGRIVTGDNNVRGTSGTAGWQHAVNAPNSTNFYVGNATNYYQSGNYNGQTYKWVAIG